MAEAAPDMRMECARIHELTRMREQHEIPHNSAIANLTIRIRRRFFGPTAVYLGATTLYIGSGRVMNNPKPVRAKPVGTDRSETEAAQRVTKAVTQHPPT